MVASRITFSIAASGALVWLVASPADGQFVQYTSPGSLGTPQVLSSERLEEAVEGARWRMGPLRVDPWYSLRDMRYNNNVFATTDDTKADVTATLGAGVRGYLPVGPNLNVALHVLPEYVWWLDLSERRKLNGRYGAGLFGYFDRLTLELEATSSYQQRYLSSELEQAVDILRQRVSAGLEIDFLEHLSVFGSASTERWEYDETSVGGAAGERLLLLERRENVARGGIRYQVQEGLTLGVGVEQSDVGFARPAGDRSNGGTAPLVEVNFAHPRLWGDLSAAFRSLDPREGSLFQDYDGITGRFLCHWRPGSRLEFELYGARDLIYSVYGLSTYFENQKLGGAVATPIGWRILARSFIETGENRYAMLDTSAAAPRLDGFTAYGGSANVELGKGFELVVSVSRVDYDSNIAGEDRSIFRLGTAITLGDRDSPWY